MYVSAQHVHGKILLLIKRVCRLFSREATIERFFTRGIRLIMY
jgi:hypothetical protein